jgi:LPXTG-site transpeptidase (sortase) family protein
MVLEGSKMPNTLFLAAHSGNSVISYFKKLDKLVIDDEVIIHYQNKKYYYQVSDIYEVEKTGFIDINKNIHENILVLTTCSKDDTKQLVVKAKLIK